MGMFRSDDGGKTFQPAGLADSDRIARIVVDPKDSSTVYVAALGKLYTTGGQRGVYRTRDGGRTWQQVLAGSDRKSTRLNSSHPSISYAVFCLKKKSG